MLAWSSKVISPEHVLGFHAIHQGVQGLLARIQWFTEHGSGPIEHRDQTFGWAVVILFRHWRFELNQAGQGFQLLQGDYVEIKVGGKFHGYSSLLRLTLARVGAQVDERVA